MTEHSKIIVTLLVVCAIIQAYFTYKQYEHMKKTKS